MHFSPFVAEKVLATVWGKWRGNFPPLFLLKENCSQFCDSWQRQDSEIPVPGEKGWLSFRFLARFSTPAGARFFMLVLSFHWIPRCCSGESSFDPGQIRIEWVPIARSSSWHFKKFHWRRNKSNMIVGIFLER